MIDEFPNDFQEKEDPLAVVFLGVLNFTQSTANVLDVTIHLHKWDDV